MSLVHQEMSHCLDLKQRRALRDKQLVAEAQKGSPDAFGQIQDNYRPQLYRTILAITMNREDAEDALQDTFLHAYAGLRCFEGRSSVYSWLTRIAINSALMVLRKRRVRAEIFLDSPSEEGSGLPPIAFRDKSLNPEQLFDQRERSVALLRAIQKLDPKLRAPMQIQLAHEASMKEIAEMLSLTVGAVKARLHRARARLTTTRMMRHSGAARISNAS